MSIRNEKYSLIGGVHPTVIAIWAALIATGRLLPTIPLVGTGSTFSVSVALIPLAGVFFGPVGGAICAGIGSFIGQLLAPHIAWLGLATFLISTVNGFAAGMAARGRWYFVLLIIGCGTGLWFSTEIGREAALFPTIFYSLGAIASLAAAIFLHSVRKSDQDAAKRPLLLGLCIFFSAYSSFVASSSLANFFGIILYQWPAPMWKGLAFVSPWERLVFSLGATLVGSPLLIALPKIGVHIGFGRDEIDAP